CARSGGYYGGVAMDYW
nr:immunoglobulin heavy chain junction region [Mus musculus]